MVVFNSVDQTTKKYNIIYQDPPWSYKDKALSGNRGACCKYNVMDNSQLYDMNVGSIASDDCVNFMWVTFPKLQAGLDLMKQQGFTYKTVAFTWVKHYRNGNQFIGMGRWTRANAEVCLLGTRGTPHRVNAGIRQIVEEFTDVIKSVPEQHSKKPDEVRDRIVQLCGDLPRIELFSRQEVSGWDQMGNEVRKRDEKVL